MSLKKSTVYVSETLRCRKTMDNAQNNSHAYCLITVINFGFKPKREENSNAHYTRDNPHANTHSKVKGCSHVALTHSSYGYEFTGNRKKIYLNTGKRINNNLFTCESIL